MSQGYSGSSLHRTGDIVVKASSDATFVQSEHRQKDLLSLSSKLDIFPRIHRINPPAIYMEYVEGVEGFTNTNAQKAGQALRRLHEQREYQHPCMTGLNWLVDMANSNLSQLVDAGQIGEELEAEYPCDALILSEPQFIEKQDGSIVFIDVESVGMGSSYQDLAHVYFRLIKDDQPEVFTLFLEGYESGLQPVDLRRVKRLAGVIALAYAGFAEFEKRVQFGLKLLREDD